MSKYDNTGLFVSGERHRNYTHGHTSGGASSTYRSWVAMMSRCYRPSTPSYANYGAVGIRVCDSWHDFANFLADMGEKPYKTSIERINGDLGYEKSNCKWATAKEQSRNLKNNIRIDIDGTTKLLVEWCEQLGVPYQRAHQRIHKYGWDARKALFTAANK